MENVSPFTSASVILSFLACLAILVAKARFIWKVLKANADVSVFNHSIVLCFAASGGKNVLLRSVFLLLVESYLIFGSYGF